MGFTARKEVRILLIGDRDVGKTSLILSLVSEEFPLDVPNKAEDITIPGDLTPERVPTLIVDYCSVEQSDNSLEISLRRCDVVCIVYSVDDEDSLDSVTEHWLPFLRRTLGETHKTPVILVGNKVDLVEYSTMETVLPIMSEYQEIETCVECSAKNLKNISEMFYFAQKAVLHPSAPLWNYNQKDLTEKCKKALTRVFRICDQDNDGSLSDYELNVFQRRCFSMDLEPGTLESLKAVVQKNSSEGLASNGGLTLKGFLTLHALFIQRGRHETTWTILRKFGYDDDLSLAKEYLFPSYSIPSGCTAELSHVGYDFFSVIFDKYDRDEDRALSPQEIVNLFSTCPMMPWNPSVYHTVPLDERGFLNIQGYQALWTLTTLLDTPKTLEYLAYLGYMYNHENQLSALNITRDKKIDLAKRQTNRNVYRCHVIGPKDSGKSTFCQGILGRSMEDIRDLTTTDELPKHTINTVQVYGQEKYLVLTDIDVIHDSSSLSPSEVLCDVACLVYDLSNPKSFEYIAKIYLKYFGESKIPVLVVANKSDMAPVRQDYILQPEAFCAKYKLPPPQKYMTKRPVKKDIFIKLATMAAFPHFRQLGLVAEETGILKFGMGIGIAVLAGIVLIRLANHYNS